MDRFDVVVIGAGAAGMMCAIEAGKRGRRVLVVDHAEAAGEKIRISGGGRCNFTNLRTGPDAFLSQNPRFAISALRRYHAAGFHRPGGGGTASPGTKRRSASCSATVRRSRSSTCC